MSFPFGSAMIIFCICFILPLVQQVYSKSYIVQVIGDPYVHAVHSLKHLKHETEFHKWKRNVESKHDGIINSVSKSALDKIYSYSHVINGFSIALTDEEAQNMEKHSEVLKVMEDEEFHLASNHAYKFLQLNGQKGVWKDTVGTNTIIGIIDSGIWPESESFRDDLYGPIPKKFKGVCVNTSTFPSSSCNRKLIGAQYFFRGYENLKGVSITELKKEYPSPRDSNGHGTHVASIAAGSRVTEAKIDGERFGQIIGISYGARLSIYKVCWEKICVGSDILAGIEAAVADNVDILSVSLEENTGSDSLLKYFSDDLMAEATFNSILAGIPTVIAAGNIASFSFSVANGYPWTLTVAASSMDILYSNAVILPDGSNFTGQSFTAGTVPSSQFFPLIDALSAKLPGANDISASACLSGTLNSSLVRGKIVHCKRGLSGLVMVAKGKVVMDAGGIGMVISLPSFSLFKGNPTALLANFHYIPTTFISLENGDKLLQYISSTKNPMARISGSMVVVGNSVEAPVMASYSRFGPNQPSPWILKPDITAPGDKILAAWPASPYSSFLPYNKTSEFNFLSGTSMAVPVVSGAVALIKAFRPYWPPSWIYSAIITTGTTTTNDGNPIKDANGLNATSLNFGGGHLNIKSALDPGLVFEISRSEYLKFLCTPSGGSGYLNGKQYINCTRVLREIDFNLPSATFYQISNSTSTVRRVTSVGSPGLYSVSILQPKTSKICVQPSKLRFTCFGQSRTFRITVTPSRQNGFSTNEFGTIIWSKEDYVVKMPIVILN